MLALTHSFAGLSVAGMERTVRLDSAIDNLLQALAVELELLLPKKKNDDRLLTSDERDDPKCKSRLNRGYVIDVMKGRSLMSSDYAERLHGRLNRLNEWRREDLQQLARVWTRRLTYARIPERDRVGELQQLLSLALNERTGSQSQARNWKRNLEPFREYLDKHPRPTLSTLKILEQKLDYVLYERAKVLAGQDASSSQTVSPAHAWQIVLTNLLYLSNLPDTLIDGTRPLTPALISFNQFIERFALDYERAMQKFITPSGIVFSVPLELFTGTQVRIFLRLLEIVGIRRVNSLSEGCTSINVRLTRAQASLLRTLLTQEESLKNLGLSSVVETEEGSEESSAGETYGAKKALIPSSDAYRELVNSFRRAHLVEALIRPWRRLRYLLSPFVSDSPLRHTIWKSDERAYALPGLLLKWKSLAVDLSMTLVSWPVLTALLIAALLSPFSAQTIIFGMMTGLALATAGAQPCSLLISPLSCGVGTVAMGTAFGFAQGIIFSSLKDWAFPSRSLLAHDFPTAIVGGLFGMAAPHMRGNLSGALIGAMICATALSIIATGWVMGQPVRALGLPNRYTKREEITGVFLGFLSGAGIGFLFGINKLLGIWLPQPYCFMATFGIVGGTWICGSTYIKLDHSENRLTMSRPIVTAIVHVLLASLLFSIAFFNAGTTVGSVALAASNGFVQSTFFTSAFIVARYRGGARASLWATILEGAVGFSAFMLVRLFSHIK